MMTPRSPMTYTEAEMQEGFALGAKRRAEARLDLIERGKVFTPIKRPKGYRKRRDRECFMNAALLAIDRRGIYVEGLACSSLFPKLAAHHAWITLDGVHAIDPTWAEPGTFYLGITFDVKTVARKWLALPPGGGNVAHLNLEALSAMPAVTS
jgi:hypothetical protein